jgi:dihydroorotate dehydrogenase
MYGLARAALFQLDAERAHGLGLTALERAHRFGALKLLAPTVKPLPVEAFGLQFPNPVGLAAGMDKNGAYLDALAACGFGFIEIGTTTPRSQPGNPKPRMFRLPAAGAVINRLGFNNAGVDALIANVKRARFEGVLGINIGKNFDTPNDRAADDYLHCLERVYPFASYVTVNISSPNTKGLRDLQGGQALGELLKQLKQRQQSLKRKHKKRVPLLLKVAPDLNEAQIDVIANAVRTHRFEGLIATNTTLDRSAVVGLNHADEAGGLSGRVLLESSTAVLKAFRERLPRSIALIGVGGIDSGAAAVAKKAAGAALVQFYTGMVYRGPQLIGECVEALRAPR